MLSVTRLYTQDAPEISEAPEEGQQGPVRPPAPPPAPPPPPPAQLHEAAVEAAAEVPTANVFSRITFASLAKSPHTGAQLSGVASSTSVQVEGVYCP